MRSTILLISICFSVITVVCSCDGKRDNANPAITRLPKILNDCDEKAVYLETSEHLDGDFSIIEVIDSNIDSVQIKCGVRIYEFTMDEDSTQKLLFTETDSVVANRKTLNNWNYNYLDSFSIRVDTTQIISTVLIYKAFLFDDHSQIVKTTRAYPVFVQNIAGDSVQVLESMGGNLQVKDRKGEWVNVISSDVYCSTGMRHFGVAPADYIVFLIPITSGEYMKEMRVSIDKTTSNSFFAKCNYDF